MSDDPDSELCQTVRDYARRAQKRLERAKGLSESEERAIQESLNKLRHAAEGERSSLRDLFQSEKESIETMLEGHEKSTFREYVESIGLAILVALTLRAFVMEAFKIPTGSMIPTLKVGDHLFVNKFTYGIRVPFTETFVWRFQKPERGEVVVFEFPGSEAREYIASQPPSKRKCIDDSVLANPKDFIKRVIGVEGDTVEVQDNQLYLNGTKVKREFIRKEETGKFLYPHRIVEEEHLGGKDYRIQYTGSDSDFGPVTVKENHLFVMGDNRDNSSDSTCWGQVPMSHVKGRAMFIWWSPGRESIRWNRIGTWVE